MIFLKKYWIASCLRKEIQLPCNPAEMALLASNHGYLERLHCAEETLSQFALTQGQADEQGKQHSLKENVDCIETVAAYFQKKADSMEEGTI